MSKRSAKAARTSSSSSQSQPSPKRLNNDEMEFNEENVSLRHILDKLANMEDRIEEHFGSLTVEISRLSAELKHMCVCVRQYILSCSVISLLTNYLHYLSTLLDAQFILAYLIYKLNASCKICLSAFRNAKLLQLLALEISYSRILNISQRMESILHLWPAVYIISRF